MLYKYLDIEEYMKVQYILVIKTMKTIRANTTTTTTTTTTTHNHNHNHNDNNNNNNRTFSI